MIARITIRRGGSHSYWDWSQDTAQAQGSPQDAAAAGRLSGRPTGNARRRLHNLCGRRVVRTNGCRRGRFGLQHHPNCSCPRCHPRHAWASFDALMWWGKGRSTPPLVTSGANGVLPDASDRVW